MPRSLPWSGLSAAERLVLLSEIGRGHGFGRHFGHPPLRNSPRPGCRRRLRSAHGGVSVNLVLVSSRDLSTVAWARRAGMSGRSSSWRPGAGSGASCESCDTWHRCCAAQRPPWVPMRLPRILGPGPSRTSIAVPGTFRAIPAPRELAALGTCGCYTGKTAANVSAKAPRTKIQVPTTRSRAPPQRLICGAFACRRSSAVSWAFAASRATEKMRRTSAAAATAKARAAASHPPVANACPARPARMGPVHPKPASR